MTHSLSGLLSDLKVQSNCVDGVAGATGVILEGSSEKSLGEEEAANPEDRWNATRDPSLQKIDPLKQVRHPRGQRLKRRVGLEGQRDAQPVKELCILGKQSLELLEQHRNVTKSSSDVLYTEITPI